MPLSVQLWLISSEPLKSTETAVGLPITVPSHSRRPAVGPPVMAGLSFTVTMASFFKSVASALSEHAAVTSTT